MGANASGKTIVFSYNEDGSRASKTVNGTRTDYIYNGSKVMRETSGGVAIDFIYDADGRPFAMKRNGAYYYYILNLQGDVIRLVNSSGATVASYEYDPYGKVISATGSMAAINPLRYRSYYYDSETGLYFLMSRYYDPAICRFINADDYSSTGQGIIGHNMFAYCLNNPVFYQDSEGNAAETVFDIISLGASVVEVCVNPTDLWAWAGLVGDAIDLIPFVTGVGEVTRAVKTLDKVAASVQIAKAVDFTDDAADIVKALDRSSGFTKSAVNTGRKIHAGYKSTENFLSIGKEYRKVKGIRPDYIDFATRTIYELKPMNPNGIRSGIQQLQKYNSAMGGGFNLVLELY